MIIQYNTVKLEIKDEIQTDLVKFVYHKSEYADEVYTTQRDRYRSSLPYRLRLEVDNAVWSSVDVLVKNILLDRLWNDITGTQMHTI